jgi:type VI secretion system protein ImpF
MPSLSPQERLQPALLDRLIDDEPDKSVEPREARLINVRKLRAAVLRDLEWLFNSARLSESELDSAQYPQVARSTLAYGLPALAGETVSSLNVEDLQSRIRSAIIEFEPRMVAATLQVRALMEGNSIDHHNQIQVEIRGSLWSVPVPIEILLRTNVDLESGEVRIDDLAS